MGTLNGIMLASLGRREMVVRLAVGFRELLNKPDERGCEHPARSLFNGILNGRRGRGSGLRKRRKKRTAAWGEGTDPSDRCWNTTVDKVLRDYIRESLGTERCETTLANEVGFEALRQALIARDRHAARSVVEPLSVTDASHRSFRIGASWAGAHPTSHSWRFDPTLAVACANKCFIFRTPAGLVAVQARREGLENLLADIVRTKRRVRIQRCDNGVFIRIDGEKMTLPAALVMLRLAELRTLPTEGTPELPRVVETVALWEPPKLKLLSAEEFAQEQRDHEHRAELAVV